LRKDLPLIGGGTTRFQPVEGLHAVTRYRPQSDKVMRLYAQTAIIENGFVPLPERATCPA
jgi:phage terminase large subunit-like protein